MQASSDEVPDEVVTIIEADFGAIEGERFDRDAQDFVERDSLRKYLAHDGEGGFVVVVGMSRGHVAGIILTRHY